MGGTPMQTGIDVEAVNLWRREAMLTGGAIAPITSMLDSDGDDTDRCNEAVVVIVMASHDVWITATVADYDFSRRSH